MAVIYALDRNGLDIIAKASTVSSTKGIKVLDSSIRSYLNSGSKILEVTLTKDNSEVGGFVEGNYVVARNKRTGEDLLFTIITVEETHDEKTLTCESAGLDLINETIDDFKADKAQPISWYLNKFLYDSGWEIGINEATDLSRRLDWEGNATTLSRIQSLATQFGVELYLSVNMKGNKIVGKYINIKRKVGEDKGVVLEYGRNVDGITRTASIENLITAVRPFGATPEGEDNPIDLKNYVKSEGSFVTYLGDNHVYDREANKTWSRYVEFNGDVSQGYIVDTLESEAQSVDELWKSSVAELQKRNHPEITYVVDIALIPDVNAGDTVYVRDLTFNKPITLSARVSEVSEDLDGNVGDVVITNFEEIVSRIDELIQQLNDKIGKIPKGDTFYPWVRYADDEFGGGISPSPTNKSYIAIKNVKNQPVPSDNPNDYKGLWVKFVGEQGVPGPAGDDGKPTYTWIMYADNVMGNGMSPDPKGKQFIGFAYNKNTETPSKNPKDYTWSTMYDTEKLDELSKKIDGVLVPLLQPNEPESPKIGQQWWQTDLDDEESIIGYFKWDGSEWIPQTIQQSILNIIELNAVKINASEFIGGQITGAKFSNAFTFQDAGFIMEGITDIEGQIKMTWKVKNSVQNGVFLISPNLINSQSYNDAAQTQLGWGWSISNNGMRTNDGQGNSTFYAPNGITMVSQGSSVNLSFEELSRIKRVGEILWSGGGGNWQMGNTVTIEPKTKITDCLTGWVMEWMVWDDKNGKPEYLGYQYSYVPKSVTTKGNNSGNMFPLNSFGTAGYKYIYITNDGKYIKGHADNLKSPNTKFVLNRVTSY